MWIFKNDAFVSIVQDRIMPDQLWVRARVKGDLERFFGEELKELGLTVVETNDADYRFRVTTDRLIVENLVAEAVNSIDYDNFKSSIADDKEGDRRHTAYMGVWSTMLRYQKSELALEPKKGKRKTA